MLRFFWHIAIWLAVAVPVSSYADDLDATDWIKKMVHAVHTVNYQGTFIYLHSNQLEAMHIIHVVYEGKEREQLVSLNGAAREVIRDKDSVICILPDNKAVSVSKRRADRGFPALLPLNLEQLSAYYDFRILGNDRVAGRPVMVIVVIPRDAYRYGYRLSLDTEQALPLKTDMLDETGQPVAQFMFTTLQVDPDISDTPSLLETAKREGFAWIQQEPAGEVPEAEKESWRFHQMPPGFSLQARALHGEGADTERTEHFVFTDGLAMLSVYVEKASDSGGLDGESRMGAVNAFGTRVAGHQVTVVGEVPAQTVRQVADNMEYVTIDSDD